MTDFITNLFDTNNKPYYYLFLAHFLQLSPRGSDVVFADEMVTQGVSIPAAETAVLAEKAGALAARVPLMIPQAAMVRVSLVALVALEFSV